MIRRLPLAVLAGLALWLAFPGWDQWYLAPVGIGTLALTVRGQSAGRAFLLGWVTGLTFFLTFLSWTAIFVGPIALVPLAILEAAYLGLFALLLTQTQQATARRLTPTRPLAVAALWTLTEYLRARTPFGGFPWGRVAMSQADSPVLGAAGLVGVPGVGFLVALAGGLLAAAAGLWWPVPRRETPGPAQVRRWLRGALAGAWGRHRPMPGADHDAHARGPAAPGAPGRNSAAAAAVIGALVVMLAPLAVPRPTDTELPPVEVALVQGNVPEVRLEFNAQRRAVLDNHLRMTDQLVAEVHAGRRRQPDLVLWPENSSDIDPLRNADVVRLVGTQVARLDAPLAVGAVLREPSPDVSNTVLVYEPDGTVVDRYTKQRPVPFAEYVPYRPFFRAITPAVDNVRADFAPGRRPGLLTVPTRTGDVRLATGICFEVADDAILTEGVRLGGEVIYIPTNNATFGFTDESVQQLAISRVRAVEHGRAVLHISNVGVSGIVLPDGTVQQPSTLYTAAILQAQVPRRTSLTVADRLGPWPERVVVGVAGAWVLTLWATSLVATVRRRVHLREGTP